MEAEAEAEAKKILKMEAEAEAVQKFGASTSLVGAIYGMYCKKCAKVVYVGKTKNRIMERFNGHCADLRKGDETKPAFHFRKVGHCEEDMEVIGLEHVTGDDDVYRVARECWWMNQMGTFEEENKKM